MISHDSRDCDLEKLMSVVNPVESSFGVWTCTLPVRGGADIVRIDDMEEVVEGREARREVPRSSSEVCAHNMASSSVDVANNHVLCRSILIDRSGSMDINVGWDNRQHDNVYMNVVENKEYGIACKNG